MRLRNIALAGIILLILATGMAGATDQNGSVTATANGTAAVTAAANDTTAAANDTAVAGAEDDGANGGMIGPENALYGLTIAFQNIGEMFTFNASEKLEKQATHAKQRIAEIIAELQKNNTEAANRALAMYREKAEEMKSTISKLPDNDTGIFRAQEMILKHELILKNLSTLHPNNTGLQRAYNNSLELKRKFESKVVEKLNAGEKPDLNATREKQETLKEEKTNVSTNMPTNVPTKGEGPERGRGGRN